MKKEFELRELGIRRCIGIRLYEARMATGFSQNDIGKILSIPRNQVIKYENGTDQLSISMLILISEALSLPLDHFLEDVKPVEWDETLIENQKMRLNLSNNFKRIKDIDCKKSVSHLLSVLARIA